MYLADKKRIMKRNANTYIYVFWFISLFFRTWYAVGAGFQLGEQSVTGIGRALAGYGVVGDDASATFYNPAGMTLFEGTQSQGALFYITTSSKFTNEGSQQILGSSEFETSGPNDDGGEDALVPAFYFSTDLVAGMKAGFGITVPFGLSTDYDKDWVGRYHALRSELKTIDINPSLAYKLNDSFSIGLGVSAQYADATLSRAIFVVDPRSRVQLSDGFAQLDGDNWSWGYNAGIMYELDSQTRFGVGYRSSIKHTLKGERELENVPGAESVGGRADLKLPETVYFGAFHGLRPEWALTMGARWTRWSRFKEIRIQTDDGGADDVRKQNWDDSWTLSIGVDYQYQPYWVFRIGYGYDDSPIPNKRFRTPAIPGNDRHWLSFGTTYEYKETLRLEVGYTHVFVADAKVDTTIDLVPSSIAPSGSFTDTLIGKYNSTNSDSIGLQIQYTF